MALLIGGYGIGQGSMFLVQTWLLARGELELLAFFGLNFAFATLGIQIIEAGSIISLTRHAVALTNTVEAWRNTCRIYWEISLFRLGVALTIVAALSSWLTFFHPNGHTAQFALCFAPALLIWAFNAAGLIDGLSLSGISGLTGSASYVVTALSLIICAEAKPDNIGEFLGLSIALGYAITVALQVAALAFLGHAIRLERPTVRGVVRAASDGASLISSQIPGQFYFRFQLLLAKSFFGAEATALLVYAKQIVVATAQLIGFIRRTEFPNLILALGESRADHALTILTRQKFGTAASLFFTVILAMGGMSSVLWASPDLSKAGAIVAIFSPVVLSSALALSFTQGLNALAWFRTTMLLSMSSAVIGMLLSLSLGPAMGVAGFAMADVFSNIFVIAMALYLLRQSRASHR